MENPAKPKHHVETTCSISSVDQVAVFLCVSWALYSLTFLKFAPFPVKPQHMYTFCS